LGVKKPHASHPKSWGKREREETKTGKVRKMTVEQKACKSQGKDVTQGICIPEVLRGRW